MKDGKKEGHSKEHHGHGKHGEHHGGHSYETGHGESKKSIKTDGRHDSRESSRNTQSEERGAGSKAKVDVERCVACGKCVRTCPEDAISLSAS